jgi:hypothetical protein
MRVRTPIFQLCNVSIYGLCRRIMKRTVGAAEMKYCSRVGPPIASLELRTVLYHYKKQPICEETTARTYTANLLVKHLSYTMRFNLSLVTLLLYALNAQPVTSAGRNRKLRVCQLLTTFFSRGGQG